jgi:hypothetical protein
MNIWLETMIMIFGIVVVGFLMRHVFSDASGRRDVEKRVLIILLLLCIMMLIYIWSGAFLWTHPRIVPVPIFGQNGSL